MAAAAAAGVVASARSWRLTIRRRSRTSTTRSVEDVPFTAGVDYPLAKHVNEVTRGGIELGRIATESWGMEIDRDTLLSILMLHDVDEPLMTIRTEAGDILYSDLSREIPHGVLGAMILKEIGFPHVVVSNVATHAANAPFHGRNFEAQILHSIGCRPVGNAIEDP